MVTHLDKPPEDDWIKGGKWTATQTDGEVDALVRDVAESRDVALRVSAWAGFDSAPARLRHAVLSRLS